MRFNVMTGVNYKILDEKINEYRNHNDNKKPYIFMNEFTMGQMSFAQVGVPSQSNTYFIIYEYMNCLVYCNNLLKNGEVELR